jgi:hypothetical protein
MENTTDMYMLQVQGGTFHPVPPYWREDMRPVDHYLAFVIAVVTIRRFMPVPVGQSLVQPLIQLLLLRLLIHVVVAPLVRK